jgi:hypothetical protein
LYCIGDIVGNGLTVAVPVAVKIQPFCVYVYVIVEVPTPATFGQNVFPTTPFPLHVPPSGDPFNGTQGVLAQTTIGITVGTTLSTNTLSNTGGLGQPSALVANTDTAFEINPGLAVPQLTVIIFVPWPLIITPGAATVHVYVLPGVFATWYVEFVDL